MTRLAWLTDIHLDFLNDGEVAAFLETISAADPDSVLITGDIGEGTTVERYLHRIADRLGKPIYFVLGNHDYYDRSIAPVRDIMRQINREQAGRLLWLGDSAPIALTPDTALVGHDGWSDGRYGDFMASPVVLSDYLRIEDLVIPDRAARLERLKALGDDAAAHLRGVLPGALAQNRRVLVALHPPPFQQATYYLDTPAADDDEYLPHFACKAVGDLLLELAPQHPDTEITVLAGHTHHAADVQPLPNLHVIVAAAEYGNPVVSRVLEL
ncbi:MAG: phosphoesterase [Chloroflexi bacterium]|nr:phosphoesterase [Chloroflexota bacterium]